uniref:Putative methyltransferase n=1 Tax=viral metagenome TaxID=1070528 RepID=A0A6M3JR85_9ZZZZ
MTTELVHFDAARRELALASNIDEIKILRDKAEALRQYIRQQGASLEMQNQCAEIKLRAERKAGEMIKDDPDIRQGGSKFHDVTLNDYGITNLQSHRWQLEASVPEPILEQHIAEVKAKGEELTSIGVQRLAARLQRKEYIDQTLSMPTNKYRTIIIDPPWPIQKIEREVAITQQQMDYQTWDLDRIRDLPLPADDNCHLYLWTTQRYLPSSFSILQAWGFAYIFTMVWHKNGGFQPFNLPQYNCEFCLFGKKGDLPFLDTKDFFTCFNGGRREHSRKPIEFYELIKRVSPEPRIEIFSREKYDGFDQYGDETNRFENS